MPNMDIYQDPRSADSEADSRKSERKSTLLINPQNIKLKSSLESLHFDSRYLYTLLLCLYTVHSNIGGIWWSQFAFGHSASACDSIPRTDPRFRLTMSAVIYLAGVSTSSYEI